MLIIHRLLAALLLSQGPWSLQQTARIWSDVSCLKFLLLHPPNRAQQQSRWILTAATWGPDPDRFQYHLIKAPKACLQHSFLNFEHQHYFHIAETALKLPTAENAGDTSSSIYAITHCRETNFAWGSYFSIHLWLCSVLPLQLKNPKHMPDPNFSHFVHSRLIQIFLLSIF